MTSDAPPPDGQILHASCVAIGSRGVLITGPSGAGKSQLAMHLIALGAALVADDRVALSMRGEAVVATAPAPLSGLIEARGVGLLRVQSQEAAEVALAVDLTPRETPRLPQRRVMRLLCGEAPLISVRPDASGASIVAALLNGAELIDPDAND